MSVRFLFLLLLAISFNASAVPPSGSWKKTGLASSISVLQCGLNYASTTSETSCAAGFTLSGSSTSTFKACKNSSLPNDTDTYCMYFVVDSCPANTVLNAAGTDCISSCVTGTNDKNGVNISMVGSGDYDVPCINGCVHSSSGSSGSPNSVPPSTLFFSVGAQTGLVCLYTGGTPNIIAPPPPPTNPEQACRDSGMGFYTFNGVTTCVPSDPLPTPPNSPSGTGTPTDSNNDGNDDPPPDDDDGDDSNDDTKAEYCRLNPDNVSCQSVNDIFKAGSDDTQITTINVDTSFNPVSLTSAAGCPSPIVANLSGIAIPIEFDWLCQYVGYFKPVVIAFSLLSGLLIILGAFKD